MLRLSKLADYGVVILATLARHPAQLHTAIRVSETTTLPGPTVSKLLKRFAKVGLLTATRGAAGGYRLAQDPAAITLTRIIEAIDGPIKIVDCVDMSHVPCGHEHACAVHGRWQPINDAITSAFSSVTLAQLMRSEDQAIQARFGGVSAVG